MTAIHLLLVLFVFRRMREGRLGLMPLLVPPGIVACVARAYPGTVPTAGNDLVLVGALVSVGAVLGVAGGGCTRMRTVREHVLIKAGAHHTTSDRARVSAFVLMALTEGVGAVATIFLRGRVRTTSRAVLVGGLTA